MNASDLERVVGDVITVLDRLQVSYHVTGGLASSFYGEPRLTQDVDFVVRIRPDDTRRLVEGLKPNFLVDLDRAVSAVRSGGMFQALHKELVIKADFHVGESIPGELDRSYRLELFADLHVRLVSKEDAILSKLLWASQGSDKSRQDVLGMLLDNTVFDLDFVRRVAGTLDCGQLLAEIEEECEGI